MDLIRGVLLGFVILAACSLLMFLEDKWAENYKLQAGRHRDSSNQLVHNTRIWPRRTGRS